MALREGAGIAVSGILYGTIVAALAGRAARSTTDGLTGPGLLVIGSTGLLVLIAAMLATWVPAASASRAGPNELLRAE